MEEAVDSTRAVARVDGIKSVIDIDIDVDVDNLINVVDPIGAAFDLRTPTTVDVPTSIICNPNRSPRDKSIKDMKNKEDGFDEGYDSDGEMGPFNNVTDKEGQQLFNEDDDDDGVCFVAERAIDGDERDVGADMEVNIVPDHVPIDSDTLNQNEFGSIKK
jgi:hypothetical protein